MEKRKSRAGQVYEFARAAVTKYHQLGGINNRSLWTQSWRPQVRDKVRDQQGQAPSEGPRGGSVPGISPASGASFG